MVADPHNVSEELVTLQSVSVTGQGICSTVAILSQENMRKRLVGMAVVGILALVPLAGSWAAQAATPQGFCPPTFEGPVAISSPPTEFQDFATFIDTQVGGNNDGQVCVTTLAPKSQGNGTKLNILDNRVAGF